MILASTSFHTRIFRFLDSLLTSSTNFLLQKAILEARVILTEQSIATKILRQQSNLKETREFSLYKWLISYMTGLYSADLLQIINRFTSLPV